MKIHYNKIFTQLKSGGWGERSRGSPNHFSTLSSPPDILYFSILNLNSNYFPDDF